jgi:hypothetical protein
LHHIREAIVRQRLAAQCKLFEPLAVPATIPALIEQEVVALLAQMIEATICVAGNQTEDGDEQDQR